MAEHAEDWEQRLPALLGALRAMPMTVLGGRSPMEIVTGLKPQLPATLTASLPIQEVGTSEYVEELLKYLAMTHKEVLQLAREAAVGHEGKDPGSLEGFAKGDLVAVRKDGESAPHGRTRFDSKVRSEVYVISDILGQNTYSLRTLLGNKDYLTSYGSNKHHGDRLVKLNMPTTDSTSVGRTIQYTTDGDTWYEALINAVALDGRVYLSRTDNPSKRVWADLTAMRYRWMT